MSRPELIWPKSSKKLFVTNSKFNYYGGLRHVFLHFSYKTVPLIHVKYCKAVNADAEAGWSAKRNDIYFLVHIETNLYTGGGNIAESFLPKHSVISGIFGDIGTFGDIPLYIVLDSCHSFCAS